MGGSKKREYLFCSASRQVRIPCLIRCGVTCVHATEVPDDIEQSGSPDASPGCKWQRPCHIDNLLILIGIHQ